MKLKLFLMNLAGHFGNFLVCVIILGLPLWNCVRISMKIMGPGENSKNVPGGACGVRGDNGDESGGAWHVVNRNKRLRKSTGGTFEPISESETVCKISKEEFKALSVLYRQHF